jgi:hypothetical protein
VITTKVLAKIVFIINLLAVIVEDFFVFAGLGVIIGTTFWINKIAGWYTLGAIFLLIGLILSRKPPRKGG